MSCHHRILIHMSVFLACMTGFAFGQFEVAGIPDTAIRDPSQPSVQLRTSPPLSSKLDQPGYTIPPSQFSTPYGPAYRPNSYLPQPGFRSPGQGARSYNTPLSRSYPHFSRSGLDWRQRRPIEPYFQKNGTVYFASRQDSDGKMAETEVPFGGLTRYKDLGGRLETVSNEWLLDLHYNYNHNTGFKDVYRRAYTLRTGAKAIRSADREKDVDIMRANLSLMAPNLKLVKARTQGWSRIQRRQIGPASNALPSKRVDTIERLLGYLMTDVGVRPTEAPPSDQTSADPNLQF